MAYISTDTLSRPLISGVSLVETVALWANVMRERRALKRMSYSQLEDIGQNPSDADREANRPFWSISHRN